MMSKWSYTYVRAVRLSGSTQRSRTVLTWWILRGTVRVRYMYQPSLEVIYN